MSLEAHNEPHGVSWCASFHFKIRSLSKLETHFLGYPIMTTPLQIRYSKSNSTQDQLKSMSKRVQFNGGEKVHQKKPLMHQNLPRPFSCAICEATFTRKYHLDRHVDGVHDNIEANSLNKTVNKYECSYCNKSYKLKNQLGRHVSTCHNSSQFQFGSSFKCTHCKKEFTRRDTLYRHMKIHLNIRPFVCNVCSAAFSRKHHLLRHDLVHSSAKPFNCKCGRSFTRKENLDEHTKIHHMWFW